MIKTWWKGENVDGQLSIFDYLESKSQFPAVINDFHNELVELCGTDADIWDKNKTEYNVWEHVPYLGYRYCVFFDYPKAKDEYFLSALDEMKIRYNKQKLEISVCVSPCISRGDDTRVSLMISTLWNDKVRAKNG